LVDLLAHLFDFVDQAFWLDQSCQLVGDLFKRLKVEQLKQVLVEALLHQEVSVDQKGVVGLVPLVFVHHFMLQLLVVEVASHPQDFLNCNVSARLGLRLNFGRNHSCTQNLNQEVLVLVVDGLGLTDEPLELILLGFEQLGSILAGRNPNFGLRRFSFGS